MATGSAGAALLLATACGPPPPPPGFSATDTGGPAATAESATDLGGMAGLVAAAKKEGTLNVIALPPDWANYGDMIAGFEAKYGVKVHSTQPDANSQDQINAARQLKGQNRAPDVFDLGSNVALANTALFAPYRTTAWKDIPGRLKDPKGRWTSDYTGYLSIGYDASKVPAPVTMNDLLGPAYKGKVALNGDPTQASAGFHGVAAASVANGGSADDLEPGVEFFKKLKARGNLIPVDPTPATIASGQTPVVLDWDYLNVAQTTALKGKVDWQVSIPEHAVVGAYYFQSINKDAPHPAAARLWQEYLYSTEGQNTWLRGYARPVLSDVMRQNGTIDKTAFAKLPKASGTPVLFTEPQLKAGQNYLQTHWRKAVN